jgi:hypothetical protein
MSIARNQFEESENNSIILLRNTRELGKSPEKIRRSSERLKSSRWVRRVQKVKEGS